MRYNHHIQAHFGACVLLAKAHDPHRARDVRVHALPGEFDVVGISDGTDAWVAPAVCRPFGVDTVRLLAQLRDTGMSPRSARVRHTLTTDAPAPTGKPRRRVLEA